MIDEEKLRKFLLKWCCPSDENAIYEFDKELNGLFSDYYELKNNDKKS